MEEFISYISEELSVGNLWGAIYDITAFLVLIFVFAFGLYILGKFLYFKYFL